MDIWNFNKGEWAEAYVFLKVLGDGRIYGADAQFHKDPLTFMDVVNIIRDEPDRYLRFERMMKNEMDYIEAYEHDAVFKVVTAVELRTKAARLYDEIMSLKGRGAGSIPDAEEYLKSLGLSGPKARISQAASERYGSKTDLIITSLSSTDHMRTTEGFSIKSHLGAAATLFNSSTTSGFLYRIKGCDDYGMNKINANSTSISKALGIIRDEYELEYIGCRNDIFADNLSLVDSRMDEIMQCGVLIFLGYYGDKNAAQLTTVCDRLADINPIGHRRPQDFYLSKMKEFLYDTFGGMTATNPWDGRKLLAGGYLDVSSDGGILYYRAVSDDIFESYLLKSTCFDSPDRGYNSSLSIAVGKAFLENRKPTSEEIIAATRTKSGTLKKKKGDWGYVFKNGEEYQIALNFQVRFK